jgi:hypothetical protein
MAAGAGTLFDNYNLSIIEDFRKRVAAGLVHTAIAISNEVANDTQTITITGNPTGGTFTLTYGGQVTTAIPWNSTAGGVQLALGGLSNVGLGNVIVTGGPAPGTPFTVTFQGTLSGMNQPNLTATALLTGGVTPAVAVAHTSAGVGTVAHAARATFAKLVLGNPAGYAALMALAVADATAVSSLLDLTTGAPTGGATEASVSTAINNQISGIWNSYI